MKMKTSLLPQPALKKIQLPLKPRRRGRPAHTYMSLTDVMEYVSNEKFTNLSQYRKWVIEQNMTSLFPKNPNLYYNNYPGVDAFLGNPPGTCMKHITANLISPENRAKCIKARRDNKIKLLSKKPSLSVCFEVLLEHNVSFSTLNKVNKEMSSISSNDAREITNVLLEFLTKQDPVKA